MTEDIRNDDITASGNWSRFSQIFFDFPSGFGVAGRKNFLNAYYIQYMSKHYIQKDIMAVKIPNSLIKRTNSNAHSFNPQSPVPNPSIIGCENRVWAEVFKIVIRMSVCVCVCAIYVYGSIKHCNIRCCQSYLSTNPLALHDSPPSAGMPLTLATTDHMTSERVTFNDASRFRFCWRCDVEQPNSGLRQSQHTSGFSVQPTLGAEIS